MEFEKINGINIAKATNPFLWKAAGVGQYENIVDKSLSHLFKRLVKEMNYSHENGYTLEKIYTFAYRQSPGLNWKGIRIFQELHDNDNDIDVIFTPTIRDIKDWETVDENKVDEFIEKNIPVNKKLKREWVNNPTWSKINPEISQLKKKNKIPDEWWIWYSADINYFGFVLKDLTYHSHSENLFIDFREYHDHLSGNSLTGPSQNFAILDKNKNYEHNYSIRGITPIIATAKLIHPYIVKFHEPNSRI